MSRVVEARGRTYRSLLASLSFFLAAHAIALPAMGLLLLPGFDPSRPLLARTHYLAEHPWLWRLGWFPWQLCALSDAWLGLALVAWTRALGLQRAFRWAVWGCLFFVLAALPEQYAEATMSCDPQTPRLAWYLWLTGTWSNTAYTLMTACWLFALRDGDRGVWPRWAEHGLLAGFAAAGIANHLAWAVEPNPAAFRLASALSGVSFVALLVLGVGFAVRIGDMQCESIAPSHSPILVRLPGSGRLRHWLGRGIGSVGTRDLLRTALSWLPFPELRSDVRDVVYLNWLVPADALESLLPRGTRVQRFGDRAALSVLVFRHGHFGPAFLGSLRRLMPSPIQCNIRAYLAEPALHVTFLTNSIDSPLYFAGSRLLSDGLAAHLPAHARLERAGDILTVDITPGNGSALAARARVEETARARLPSAFAEVFGTFEDAVAYLVPQDAAVRVLPSIAAECTSRISVDAVLSSARPAFPHDVQLGAALDVLIEGHEPLAFVLPSVTFHVRGESLVAWAGESRA